MTDDITRGLTALADEADPAPIDSHTVVQLAHAHTRSRRAIVASAVATVLAVGALVATVSTIKEPSGGDTATSPTATSTAPPPAFDAATAEENAERRPRLQAELTNAFVRILPEGWRHSTFAFGCDVTGCFAEGDIIDETGPLTTHVYVSSEANFGRFDCSEPVCAGSVLDDGTSAQVTRGDMSGGDQEDVNVSAFRPDGTVMSMWVRWPADRPRPTLTDEQWMQFGKALTY